MAETKTGIAMEFESRSLLGKCYGLRTCASYPKPGLSRECFMSLLMCFPVTCMLWAAILYGAFRLAR